MIKKNITEYFRVRVQASELKLGMYVCKLDRPWEETPFLLQGFIIQKPNEIEKIQKYCDHVYISVQKSIHKPGSEDKSKKNRISKNDSPDESTKRKLTIPKIFRTKKSVSRETWENRLNLKHQDLEQAQKDYKNAFSIVKSTMDDIKIGHSIDTKTIKDVVSVSVESIFNQAEAMLLMSRLKSKDEYTSQHSLNVSVLSIALGNYIGLNKTQLNEVGLCGILHDMGKMLTPEHILNKPDKLTEDENIIMQRHTTDGHDILSSTDGVLKEAIHVAHAHHEKLDGTGYPQGLSAKDLSLYNKIVTIADAYDAITSDRVYKKGQTVESALQIIHNLRGTAFDPVIGTQFIERVGIYPLGTFVELHNGEIGIVMHTSPEKRLRPWVKV
ncbi:MAG: HD-GYP domain-containing protein, partial [Draconibacterium sp.]|nr:HD-GYP domain-containing protein [Draconibacterium sp.]